MVTVLACKGSHFAAAEQPSATFATRRLCLLLALQEQLGGRVAWMLSTWTLVDEEGFALFP
ncbi:MAG: hypothetical protein Q4D66_05160 [Bacteroidales bacterium]|nr:hypothetical protein [Bacteroidales bacterium]